MLCHAKICYNVHSMSCCYVTLQYTGTWLLHMGVYARFQFISQTAAGNWAHFSNEITKTLDLVRIFCGAKKEHLGLFVLTFTPLITSAVHMESSYITRLIISVKHLSNGNTNKLLTVIWELLISAHFWKRAERETYPGS